MLGINKKMDRQDLKNEIWKRVGLEEEQLNSLTDFILDNFISKDVEKVTAAQCYLAILNGHYASKYVGKTGFKILAGDAHEAARTFNKTLK